VEISKDSSDLSNIDSLLVVSTQKIFLSSLKYNVNNNGFTLSDYSLSVLQIRQIWEGGVELGLVLGKPVVSIFINFVLIFDSKILQQQSNSFSQTTNWPVPQLQFILVITLVFFTALLVFLLVLFFLFLFLLLLLLLFLRLFVFFFSSFLLLSFWFFLLVIILLRIPLVCCLSSSLLLSGRSLCGIVAASSGSLSSLCLLMTALS